MNLGHLPKEVNCLIKGRLHHLINIFQQWLIQDQDLFATLMVKATTKGTRGNLLNDNVNFQCRYIEDVEVASKYIAGMKELMWGM